MREPSNRAKASAAYIVRAVRLGAVHCVIGISSSAWDQPGHGAPLPQLPGQVVGVSWTPRCFAAELTAGRGGLMTRAESPARKTPAAGRHGTVARAT
jgi:hypothetical protein